MLNKLIEIILSLILLLPVFCLLHKYRFHDARKTIWCFLFAGYLAAVYLFVGLPTLQFMRFELSVTLIPFLPMAADLKNTILNVFLFVPLGILAPFLWKKYSTLKSTVLLGFVLSLAIELLQIFTYRATDINDLIANTLGAGFGYLIFRMASRRFPSMAKFANVENEVPILILSVLVPMFFLQPYLATLYYAIF